MILLILETALSARVGIRLFRAARSSAVPLHPIDNSVGPVVDRVVAGAHDSGSAVALSSLQTRGYVRSATQSLLRGCIRVLAGLSFSIEPGVGRAVRRGTRPARLVTRTHSNKRSSERVFSRSLGGLV